MEATQSEATGETLDTPKQEPLKIRLRTEKTRPVAGWSISSGTSTAGYVPPGTTATHDGERLVWDAAYVRVDGRWSLMGDFAEDILSGTIPADVEFVGTNRDPILRRIEELRGALANITRFSADEPYASAMVHVKAQIANLEARLPE